MLLQIIISILIAYLIGSIPSAYILVRLFYKQDITGEGSGNVGTLNVLRTTKSKALAFVVLVLDFSKGLIVILLAKHFYSDQPIILGILAIVVVFGHNYTIWLNFHGGRGLATSAGVLIVFAPIILGIWLVCWLITYLILRQIIFASVISIFGILIFFVVARRKVCNTRSRNSYFNYITYRDD